MAWSALSPDALIAVVAPAGPALAGQVDQVQPLIEAQGWRARLYPSCRQARGYLAGSDEQRLADLHDAFADPEVKAVMCLRGGYGCGRLLERVNADLLSQHDKPFVGYSDITALHALRGRLGLWGLHGPMLASDLIKPERHEDRQALFDLLRHGLVRNTTWSPRLEPELQGIGREFEGTSGVVEGPLVGGNLSLMAALIGTPYQLPVDGAIVFLEEVAEEPYRVDRMMVQLRQSGALRAAAGFLVGRFSDEASPRGVLEEFLAPLGKPILAGWPTGHGTPHWTLPMGPRCRLDARAGTLTLLQDVILPPSP
jgi:muramoyltetrapeptide carboxypeptidase